MRGSRTASLAMVLALMACDGKSAKQQGAQNAPPPAVVVAKAESRDMRHAEQFTGRVQAMDEVSLMARVQGFLEKRLFEEGATVKPGQLLFVIDKKPFVAEVEQRQAAKARAEADARNAEVQLVRGRELLRTNNIPKSEVDKREAAFLMADAQVKQADAALTEAEIQLGYTEIRAPIAGRIGQSRYSQGALVGPGAPPLATIVRSDPIYVVFPVSQRTLLEFRKRTESGSREVSVRLTLADGSLYREPGKVDFLDVRADPGTDSVNVRAQFPNPDGTLVPGQFAGVVAESGQPVAAIIVPQSALQLDQAGPFVLVVDGTGKVENRRVQAGAAKDATVAIEQGLKPGEHVIVEGVQKVKPGQEVQISELPNTSQGAGQ